MKVFTRAFIIAAIFIVPLFSASTEAFAMPSKGAVKFRTDANTYTKSATSIVVTGRSPVTGTMIAVRLLNKKGNVMIYRDVHLTRGKPHFRVSFPTKKLKPGKYDVWVDAVRGKRWHGELKYYIVIKH
ncbi:hypothetical protein P9D34_04455 [Bacillus swezeyi]|uniref:DUF3324 domain-containing protein n=1 Tax=Bacillus swezeyi TaxID=1925020 RepID=A0A1R1Q8C3_9BACI|nr:hypothetical protein [Bacillus swezeyi]MEC1259711.1 hypothetical protein [Bacillus swezeyi]MED1739459.1 hypothetical protein [Bacillus swezeyi]MED2927326.1 hypothetical protein [Bacillus swezeyi]MED2941579.1 hypothetical protein [Bacillus swezeyi]MED2962524.1 hypothetical protein [Bacillus swezeyi]